MLNLQDRIRKLHDLHGVTDLHIKLSHDNECPILLEPNKNWHQIYYGVYVADVMPGHYFVNFYENHVEIWLKLSGNTDVHLKTWGGWRKGSVTKLDQKYLHILLCE